jgi:hypothetical protein
VSAEKRWVDELPLAATERELLLAGKAARPPNGTVDADWRAFCVALNAPSITAASGAAAHSASVKAASGVVSKAGAGGLFGVATLKSFAVGVALGVGVSGASAVVQHVSQKETPPPITARPTFAPKARAQPAAPGVESRATEVPAVAIASASAQSEATSPPPPVEARALTSAVPTRETSSPAASASAALGDSSLSQQARELAVVKRLLDSGAASEALRRLQASFGSSGPSTLSEERDALYVQALAALGRQVEARALARRFLDRYPRSPYLGTMRRLADP